MRALLAATIFCLSFCAAAHAEPSVANPLVSIVAVAKQGRIVVGRDVSAMRSRVTLAAISAGVPVNIADAVVRVESGYNPRAMSASGAYGLGQVLCSTARRIGFSGPCSELRDPDVNLRYAMAYLRLALDRGGAGCAGVSLYNRGVAARPVCTGYGRMVLALAR